jgi:phosphatidylethanolamine-binding protein (PEBP) family uncharacterized protein
MHLASRAFENGGRIPTRFTCDGDNEIPPLAWTGVPSEARSLALVCSDPDAPSGTFHHWAVYDIPPDVRHLPDPTRARFSPLLFPALRVGCSDARPGLEGPLPGGRASRRPARACGSRPHRALRPIGVRRAAYVAGREALDREGSS